MFRCDNCGSGYSAQAASSWQSCPRCLAKDRLNVPLNIELGWRQRTDADQSRQAIDPELGPFAGPSEPPESI